MKKALLIANGPMPSPAFIKECAKNAQFILAADGGALAALEGGVKPNAVIGDFDSLGALPGGLEGSRLIKISGQDNTDFEKALDYLAAQKFEVCDVIGAFGGRADFSVANFFSCFPYLEQIKIRFLSEKWTIYPLTKGGVFACKPGKRLSLVPLAPCKKLSLLGVKYPLKDAEINPFKNAGFTLSNKTAAQNTELSFDGGFLLLYIEN